MPTEADFKNINNIQLLLYENHGHQGLKNITVNNIYCDQETTIYA